MAIELAPLPLPASANPSRLKHFGREVIGLHPGKLTPEQFKEVQEALYKYDALLFRNVVVTPEEQYALTKSFDPQSESFGHDKVGLAKTSILSYLKTIPRVPQVMIIGNGTIYNHEGLAEVELKHPSHIGSHITRVPPEDELKATRFCRWHIDAALYDLNPSKVTTLHGLKVPKGDPQTCRYDDGTGDELSVPLGATTFASGRIMFDILPREYKSLAVRTKVKYAPHPYIWMAPARAMPTALGLECEGRELPLDKLPPWEESKIKVYPMVWKNPVTGNLHFQVHPWAAQELFIDPLPEGVDYEGALYPRGTHITDLKEVRALLYKMQRPAIAPEFIYPHDWQENDFIIFHNRGVLHTAVGAFTPGQVRLFHQCNMAATDEPAGPTAEDVKEYA